MSSYLRFFWFEGIEIKYSQELDGSRDDDSTTAPNDPRDIYYSMVKCLSVNDGQTSSVV